MPGILLIGFKSTLWCDSGVAQVVVYTSLSQILHFTFTDPSIAKVISKFKGRYMASCYISDDTVSVRAIVVIFLGFESTHVS